MKRVFIILALALMGPSTAFGVTDADWAAINYTNSTFYNENDADLQCSDPSSGGATPGGTTGPASTAEITNAKIVIGIAKTLNLGKQGALIGLMTGLAESGLHNHASNAVPISLTFPHDDAPPADHDSVGVFQQRAGGNWAPVPSSKDYNKNVEWLMKPAYSAEAFFAMPAGKLESKAMVNVPNWQTKDPGVVAQTVQVSAFPDAYNRHKAQAQSLIDQYYDSTSPLALPQPLASGGGGGGGGGSTTPGTNCAVNSSFIIPPGPIAGCVNPFAAEPTSWGLARTDQGVDYVPTRNNMPIRAICDGVITQKDTNTGWGQAVGGPGGWIGYKITAPGPFKDKCIYIAEEVQGTVNVGVPIKAGQVIGTAFHTNDPAHDPATEWGWTQSGKGGRHTPSTPYNGAADGTPMPGGKAFARFLRHLNAKTAQDPGPGPEYDGASCP